ncbi:diguanylate cyclase [Agrobacterium sp. NPDC090273]|uniref:diguanylate cyclase n=1 Tax=Agrobacterium sp. NPDC090273 TaxID=3363919 RepID=UPI00383BC715
MAACAVSIAQSTAQLTLFDFAVRYGGEEILLVMPNTDVDTANDRIDNLRRVLDAKTFTSEKLHVTFSAGIAEYRHGSRKEFLIRADNALNDAKNSGRNSTKLA